MRRGLGLVVAIFGSMAGCQQPCGLDASGVTGLTVTVEDRATKDGGLGEGSYVFTLTTELGEVTWSCVVDAARPDGEGCGTSQVLGSEDAEEEASLLVAGRVVGGEYRVELSLLEPGSTSGPATLGVRVVRDGEIVGEATYEPEYTLARAGGDGCGQAYVAAEAPTLELAAASG